MYATTQCRGVLVSACVALYFSYARVCKFLHACLASYTRVHASKISTRVFVSAVCVSHACLMREDFVSHAWDTRVTRVDRLSCG